MSDNKPRSFPVESNAGNKPTNREVREEFYRNIEIKLTFLKELKHIIDIASINDDPKITSANLNQQYKKIHEHFSETGAAETFSRIEKLEVDLDTARTKEKTRNLLQEEIDEDISENLFEIPFQIAELKKHPDVAFWVNIRDIIADLKEKNRLVKELYDNPKKFRTEVARFYYEYASIEFEKVETLYSAFGITFIVPAPNIREPYKSFEGFHLQNTPFSFVKADSQNPQAQNDTVRHEEMHNILDRIDNDLKHFPKKFQSKLLKLKNYIACGNTSLAEQEYKACVGSLNYLQNEFLVDMEWIQHDITRKKSDLLDYLFSGKPSTANTQMRYAINLISTGIKEIQNQAVTDALKKLEEMMQARFERIRSEMRLTIEYAEDMVGLGHLEARQEAYLLFFLFPPLEYRRAFQFLRHKYSRSPKV